MMDAGFEFEIVRLPSGTATLRSNAHGETFHPVIGPMAEAMAIHVSQQNLAARAKASAVKFVIWDVGLGAAANAIAAVEPLRRGAPAAEVELHSFDRTLDPLTFALAHADALGYVRPWEHALHALAREGSTRIEMNPGRIDWRFHHGDFLREVSVVEAPAPDAIFYDPYSPAANPEMWSWPHFSRLFLRLDPARPCLLTCYSRSTAVRVTLLLAGFFVGVGSATGEKEETTIASNDLHLLAKPLNSEWLGRVRRSTNAAPLIGPPLQARPISAEDFERLNVHPQFRRG